MMVMGVCVVGRPSGMLRPEGGEGEGAAIV